VTTLLSSESSLASPPSGRPNPYAPPRPYRPGNRKIRVLLISHTCQSRTEGQPKAHALAALPDIELHLLIPRHWKHYGTWRTAQPPLAPRFHCTIAPVRFPWAGPAQHFLHYYPQLPRLLESFQPDVIDLWEEAWGWVSAHTCTWRNRVLPRAKIISETEQNISKNLPFPFEKFRDRTLKSADHAVSRNVEGATVIRGKGYRGPVDIVPNAVDTRLFHPFSDAARKAARKSLHIEGFTAGYVGRLVPEKGLLDMLEALAGCPSDVRMLLVGSGPLQREIETRAEALGLTGRIRIQPAAPLEQVPELMNALDVLVLPSRTTGRWKEQFGRVIIEAGACGIPVIGSDSAAIPDVVGEAGLIFPEGNAAALREAITTLRSDPALARRLGQIGRTQAETFYTWDQVAQRMATIYQTVTQ